MKNLNGHSANDFGDLVTDCKPMFFLSPSLLRSHSKRMLVQLKSAALTNFFYMTHKSPSKKNTRIALRKHDPRAGKHV